MIGIMIFEASVLHWVTQYDKKSLDEDYCRTRADHLHLWQVDLNALRNCWLRFPDVDLKADLRESLTILRRLEIHFSKRAAALQERWNNNNYARDYARSMGGP